MRFVIFSLYFDKIIPIKIFMKRLYFKKSLKVDLLSSILNNKIYFMLFTSCLFLTLNSWSKNAQLTPAQKESLKSEQIQNIKDNQFNLLTEKKIEDDSSKTEATAGCLDESCWKQMGDFEKVDNLVFSLSKIHDETKMGEILKKMLNHLKGEERVEFLQSLANLNPNLIKTIIKIAGDMGGKEGLSILNAFRHDSHKDVQIELAKSAGKIGDRGGVEILHALKYSSDMELKEEVAYSAAKIGSDGIPILDMFSKNHPDNIRFAHAIAQVKASKKITKDEANGMLQTMMKKAKSKTTKTFIAGEIGDVETLLAYAKSSSEEIQNNIGVDFIANAAGKLKKEEGFQVLDLLTRKNLQMDESDRKEIIRGAGALGGERGVEIQLVFINDPKPTVRNTVLNGIVKEVKVDKDNKAWKALHVLMKDPDPKIAKRAKQFYSLKIMQAQQEQSMTIGRQLFKFL